MDKRAEELNSYLVEIFNEILKTEENVILKNCFSNLSLNELHVIEAVLNAEKNNQCKASEIAATLRVTGGTLTTAVSILEKKGYLFRQKCEKDRRVVYIHTTDLGKKANEKHAQFHSDFVADIIKVISAEELGILLRALGSVNDFLKEKI